MSEQNAFFCEKGCYLFLASNNSDIHNIVHVKLMLKKLGIIVHAFSETRKQ